MKRDAEWYRWKHLFQYMLSEDKWYMESIKETRESTGDGVRQESSLQLSLSTLASEMADIECGKIDDYEARSYYQWMIYTHTNTVKKQRGTEAAILRVVETDVNSYHAALDHLPANLRPFLDSHIQADKYYVCKDKQNSICGGFATTHTGYLTGIFSLKRGYGSQIFEKMLEQAYRDADKGVEDFTLFCTGSKLEKFYRDYGFKVDRVIDWSPELADENWDYQKFGTPLLYDMSRKIHTISRTK